MDKLSLTEWAEVAEVVGAVAVVISLVYVGIQVQENTEEIRASNRQQLVGRAHGATNNVATSPELASAFAKVASGEQMTPSENIQYRFFVRSMLYDVQEAYLLYREARLDEGYWSTRASLFSAYMEQERARQIYNRDMSQGVFHVDFVDWANDALKEIAHQEPNDD